MTDPQIKSISFQAFTKDLLLPDPPLKPITEEDLQKLKLEFKQKENCFKKDSALKEQKIELLDIQIKEAKEREENLRKMNDNLTSALSELSQDPKKFSNNGLKEIQQTLEKNSKDFIENKMKNNELVKVLESEIKKLQEANHQETLRKKDEDLKNSEEKLNFSNKIREIEAEKTKLEGIIKQIQMDQRKSFDTFTWDNQMKRNKNNEAIDKIKEMHEKEMLEMQEKAQEHFNEMKNIYEQEKTNLEARLEKAQASVKQFLDTSDGMDIENLSKENQKLIETLNLLSHSHSEESKLFKKCKDELLSRIHALELEISRNREENSGFLRLKDEKKKAENELESVKGLLKEYQHNFVIHSNETNCTPQLRCEGNGEIPYEEEQEETSQENSAILKENPMNKSQKKSQKSNSISSEDFEKIELKLFNDKLIRNLCKKSSKKPSYFNEELRKTPIQNKSSSRFQKPIEKAEKSHISTVKTSRNNENMPIPISEIGLKSDRNAQILENTSYKKPKKLFIERKRLSENSPYTAMISLNYPKNNGFNDKNNEFYDKNYQQNNELYDKNYQQNNEFYDKNYQKNNELYDKNYRNNELLNQNYNELMNYQQNNEENDENLNNIATALLCEICKNTYPPLEFLDHLTSCKSQRSLNFAHNPSINHHSSHQNLPIYPQSSNYSSYNDQKRTKSFHYQSSQQLNNNINNFNNINNIHKNMNNINNIHKNINNMNNNMNVMNNNPNNNFNNMNKTNISHNMKNMLNNTNNNMNDTNNANNIMNNTNNSGFPSGISHLNDPKILNVLENLNYEKKLIFEKLREVEDKLKHTEDKNYMLNDEKEGLEMHFESIVTQLKQAQMQLVLTEEEKSENELNLKKEIKFLINKLLKAKNKLSEEKNVMKSHRNSSVNMSGFMNFYQQNREDSTFGDKNGDSETSILNQSIQQIIGNSALTVNHNTNDKSPIIQKFREKVQIQEKIKGKIGGFVKKNEGGRSKTPIMVKKSEGVKSRGYIVQTDFIDTMDYNNRFKKK